MAYPSGCCEFLCETNHYDSSTFKRPAVEKNAQPTVTNIVKPANKHRASLASALNAEGHDAVAPDSGMFAPVGYLLIHHLDHDLIYRCLSEISKGRAAMSPTEL